MYPKLIEKYLENNRRDINNEDDKNIQSLKVCIKNRLDSIGELSGQVRELKILLKSTCKHQRLIVSSTYFEGSFNDKAYTEYKVVCEDCGTQLFSDTKEHSFFG
ncbi:Atg1 family protein [Candidatus Dojkabacteria bacterium]|jgi:hypothetical protein|nr:Atg1 family protein [Candidatus Dojkabacteria bacterium]